MFCEWWRFPGIRFGKRMGSRRWNYLIAGLAGTQTRLFAHAGMCGHMLAADTEGHPVARFCSQCGAVILSKCSGCDVKIRGYYVPPGTTGVGGPLSPPAYCFSCGQSFPWTIEKLSTAKDLTDELDNISAEDRAKLKTAIDDVAAGGPRAEVGALHASSAWLERRGLLSVKLSGD